MKMHPTMRLMWVEAETDAELSSPCSTNVIGYCGSHYRLHQYWQDDNGDGEWRIIEVEE